jgi:3-phosphoshikimate 1-carboxyvinyltransferase
MAFAIAGMFADGETIVQDVECVRESYPGFEKALDDFVSSKRVRVTTPVISSLTPARVDEE